MKMWKDNLVLENDKLMKLGLKDFASTALLGRKDFQYVGEFKNRPVYHDISYKNTVSKNLVIEGFKLLDKKRYSLKIDEKQIPFATIEKSIFPGSYKAKVEILPCMVPKALETLTSYVQNESRGPHPIRNMLEISAVKNKLEKIIKKNTWKNMISEIINLNKIIYGFPQYMKQ